jgi:ribosomal protein L30E
MIQEGKDIAANMITVAGTGSVVMGFNEALTLMLLVTGIIFNVVRIYEIKKKKKD